MPDRRKREWSPPKSADEAAARMVRALEVCAEQLIRIRVHLEQGDASNPSAVASVVESLLGGIFRR